MTSFWCDRALIGSHVRSAVRIVESDGRIRELHDGVAARAGDVELSGLTLPGLANAHSHAFHRALRGTTHSDGGTFWSWRSEMYALSELLDPQNYRPLAAAVFAEMMLAGFTLVGEFHYIHGRQDGAAYENADMERAILLAAADAGIRITLLDTLYLRGGLDADGHSLALSAEQRRFSDGSVSAWAERRAKLIPSATARIAAAVHSVRAADAEDLRAFRAVTLGEPVHAHVSEQPAENDQVRASTGLSPIGVLADAGLVNADFTAVHATHLENRDVDILGSAGSFACFCPTTERDLADGIGPAVDLASAGASLTIGTDQHAMIDPFEEMRGVEMNERLASGDRGRFTPQDLILMASANGYRSLGWDGGTLETGALCDLIAVDTVSVRTAGTRAEQLWLAATGADVTDVVVGGRHVVRQGRHEIGDVAALLASALAEVRA